MPLPRAGTAGMVQYLDPSEPSSRARLERSALFARKAAPAVGARFETQGWAWRDAEAAAAAEAATALRRTPSTTPLPPPTNEEIAFLS